MAAVKELIRCEDVGTLSFGDYTLDAKTKKDGFEFQGAVYKVKTFREITKLEKNGAFVYESVPGTSVENFYATSDEITFSVSGPDNVMITIGVEADQEYTVYLNDISAGDMKVGISAKLNISVELGADTVAVRIKKK